MYKRQVTPRTDEPVSQEYVTQFRGIVNERFTYSARIIETDYYRILFDAQNEAAESGSESDKT